MKLLVDSNVFLDSLQQRGEFAEPATKFLVLGYLHEHELYASSSQITDVFYVLSECGKKSLCARAKQQVKGIRQFTEMVALGNSEIDAALDSNWEDFEDACVYQAARKVKADVIITRNKDDYKRSSIKVMDCEEFFDYLAEEKGLVYDFVDF